MVEITEYPPLLGSSELLPTYEFIKEVEEFPNVTIIQEYFGLGQALVSGPVDSFWFFQLDPRSKVEVLGTPATIQSSLPVPSLPLSSDQFPIPVENIIGANGDDLDDDDEELVDDLPDMPIAKPGSFQLFLPDPEMMDRVGELGRDLSDQNEQIFKNSQEAEASTSSKTINKPEDLQQQDQEIKTGNGKRSIRDESKQRGVTFADDPVSGSQEPPTTSMLDRLQVEARSKSEATKSRLVSYQKIRDRSGSRNSRFAAATQQVNRYFYFYFLAASRNFFSSLFL